MSSLVPKVRGFVKVEVIKQGKVTYVHETPNTLVLEAPKILLGNIVGAGLTTEGDTFSSTDPARPSIPVGGSHGASNRLTVSYLKLGYALTSNDAGGIAVSADDTAMGSGTTVTRKLTNANIGEYSVQFICSFDVTADTESYNYFEAALLCPALSDQADMGIPPEPTDPSFSEDNLVMFAHQVHNPVQASEGSTIRYTWTITMQEPS